MDLSPSPPNSSSSSPSSALAAATCHLAGRVLYVVVTCVFASGSVVGAATGCVVGMATESGMLRGAGVGAISGAVVSVEIADAWRDIWRSGGSGVLWTILYVVDIVSSLLSGGLVQEKVGLAVQSAVERQISAISSPFGETIDLYETGGARGIPAEALRRLPEMEIAAEDDTAGAGAGAVDCSVCLQDFRVGETARMLPGCRHVFHAPCIDCWLVRHGSCPLCRRDM